MKDTRLIMGMPIEIEIAKIEGREKEAKGALEAAYAYLVEVDNRFSTYKEESEISRFNRGEVKRDELSPEMQEVFAIGEETRERTYGYFDIRHPDGHVDPSGVVKGLAIKHAAELIRNAGFEDYMVNAGGDIAMHGTDDAGGAWSVGIRNPFNIDEIVKVVYPGGKGIATSGSYIRGAHIYSPHEPGKELKEIVSITVIGPDVLEADLMATAAFAMGTQGAGFIERLDGYEAYAIDAAGTATFTSGFAVYTEK